MVMLQGGGQNPPPCVCYPKDPMWNRVKYVLQASAWLRLTMSNMCWHAFGHSLPGQGKQGSV